MEGPGSDNPFCKSRGFLWAREGCLRKNISCDNRRIRREKMWDVIHITQIILFFFLNISSACLVYLITHNLRPEITDNLVFASSKQKMENKERQREEINYSPLYEEQMAVGHTVYGTERIFLFCSQPYWIQLGMSKIWTIIAKALNNKTF